MKLTPLFTHHPSASIIHLGFGKQHRQAREYRD